MKQFELDKGYEEVEIAGDTYRIDLSDESRKRNQVKGQEISKMADRLQSISNDFSEEELNRLFTELQQNVKPWTDSILGEGSYDKIYQKANQSVFIVVDVTLEVLAYVNEKEQEKFEKKRKKYTKKKK